MLLAPTEEANVYEVALAPVVGSGSAANCIEEGINFDNGNIVMIVHSSSSYPGYPNWEQKVAAMALKVGDKVLLSGIDLIEGTVSKGTITVQNDPDDPTSEEFTDSKIPKEIQNLIDPSTPWEVTGDGSFSYEGTPLYRLRTRA